MKTITQQTTYKKWNIVITINDAFPSHPYEWELHKDAYEVLDSTSWSDLPSCEAAAKEVVDFHELKINKRFLKTLIKPLPVLSPTSSAVKTIGHRI